MTQPEPIAGTVIPIRTLRHSGPFGIACLEDDMRFAWLVTVFLLGCGSMPDLSQKKDDETKPSPPTTQNETNTNTEAETNDTADETGQKLCQPSKTFSSTDMIDFESVVKLINALPFPLTLDCVLKTLPRPYALTATQSRLSVQPAGTDEEPRLFISYNTKLYISVTPGKEGGTLLEMSLLQPDNTSLKGEIAFPLVAAISPDLPYTHILRTDGVPGTRCAGCHSQEQAVAGQTNRFVSKAFKPRDTSIVSLFGLKELAKLCKKKPAEDSCHRIEIVVNGEGITEHQFPGSLPTMF